MFNWTYEEFIMAITKAFEVDKLQCIDLDVERCDSNNMKSIIFWAKQRGYHAEDINSDIIRVYKKGWTE